MAQEEKPAVERLKGQLYSRDAKTDTGDERTPLSEGQIKAPTAWSDVKTAITEVPSSAKEEPTLTPMRPKRRTSIASKFLLGSFAFFIVASGIAAYMFFGGGNVISPANISMEVVAPSLIDGGKAATFQLLIQNRNEASLEQADLIIDYPDGTRATNNPTKVLAHERQAIGTIHSGEQIKREFSGLFYGPEGTGDKIKVTLEYTVAGSNAIFQKEAEADFTIGSSPVSVSVTAPNEAISGEAVPLEVQIRSNATTPVENVVVQAQYPFGWSFSNATPRPSAGGTFWRLGTMAPGSVKTIHIQGSLDGQDGDQRVFRFLVGSNTDTTDTQVKVPFLTVPQTLVVHRPFISGVITVAGQSGKNISVSSGQKVSGSVTWQNNTPDPISNLQVLLTFEGPALDKNSIQGDNGFYQSSNSSIIWSSVQESSLTSVAPGATGKLNFSFATLPVASGNVLITNPIININLAVQGVRESFGGTPEQVSSAATAVVQLASQVSLAAQSFHSGSGAQNFGPIPPKAEVATSYTIIWTVKNSSNALANTAVSATLPPYVDFFQAPQSSDVTYDEGSRTVKWNIGDVKAGAGYSSSAAQTSFQVTLHPSVSQVGQAPQLINEATLTGQDRFAQVPVSTSVAPVTTHTSDPNFSNGMDIVSPK
jgi:hypothetical protein